jgi:hypothetical protein
MQVAALVIEQAAGRAAAGMPTERMACSTAHAPAPARAAPAGVKQLHPAPALCAIALHLQLHPALLVRGPRPRAALAERRPHSQSPGQL